MIPVVDALGGGHGDDAYCWALSLGRPSTIAAADGQCRRFRHVRQRRCRSAFRASLRVGMLATFVSLLLASGDVLLRYVWSRSTPAGSSASDGDAAGKLDPMPNVRLNSDNSTRAEAVALYRGNVRRIRTDALTSVRLGFVTASAVAGAGVAAVVAAVF